MTDKQPEALRLADDLDELDSQFSFRGLCGEAAAELRRLHDVNAELVDALKAYGSHTSNCDYLVVLTSLPPQRKPCSCGLHAILAKAEGEE